MPFKRGSVVLDTIERILQEKKLKFFPKTKKTLLRLRDSLKKELEDLNKSDSTYKKQLKFKEMEEKIYSEVEEIIKKLDVGFKRLEIAKKVGITTAALSPVGAYTAYKINKARKENNKE